MTESRSVPLQALVVDYGGVLTSPLNEAMRAWCEVDGIDMDGVRRLMRDWTATDNPAHALERGELAAGHFEQELAARLSSRSGGTVDPEGLLTRMFAGFRREQLMVDVVRRVRGAGLKCALLSNSWGLDYDREGWDELFDVLVISGEVGMRKPEERIYLLTAHKLGLPTSACVFVDDLRVNVTGAVAAGMVGVHHVSVERTVAELEALLELDLAA